MRPRRIGLLKGLKTQCRILLKFQHFSLLRMWPGMTSLPSILFSPIIKFTLR